MNVPTGELVKAAWSAGADIDLRGVGYGREHWGDQTAISTVPFNYYRFLAGLARLIEARTILEIGTHWGGSAVALARGSLRAGMRPHVVTIDITTESDAFLPEATEGHLITKIVGDANTYNVCRNVADLFSGVDSVDLLYIDADHQTLPTLFNFSLYHALLSPKVTVADDITLSPAMNDFWLLVSERFPGHSVNAALIEPMIREQSTNPGFGLVVNPRFEAEIASRVRK